MDPRLYYREATVTGANPIELVVRLYEQIIEDLRQAIRALEEKKVELRTTKINHSILVIGYLESALKFAEDGPAARNLRTFYRTLRANLAEAQFRQSKEILARQITDLLALREAWISVERSQLTSVDAQEVAANPLAPQMGTASLEWNG